jgi:peptidoglycan/xylan/chitin deacetylase (PgdA/CDA1 family)
MHRSVPIKSPARFLAAIFLFFGLSIPALLSMPDHVQPIPVPPPATPQTAPAPAELSFGSEAILQSCWTGDELAGSPADKRTIRPYQDGLPDRPERLAPKVVRGPEPPTLQNSIRYVMPADGKKIVALTFDLCERANEKTGYDAAIVNYLRANNIKATFFAGGKWMRSHPEQAMQLMSDPRFEVGNHGWTHGNLRLLKGEAMEDQVMWAQAEYEVLRERLAASDCARSAGPEEMEKIPPVPMALRLPYGTCNPDTLKFLAQVGLPAVQWTIVSGDSSRGQTAGRIIRAVMDGIRPGAIIIMHANGRGHGTAQALPRLVPMLQQMGYEFVTVTELLNSGPAFTTTDCYEITPGDNTRYDRIYGKGT